MQSSLATEKPREKRLINKNEIYHLSRYGYDVQLPQFQLSRDILNQLSMAQFCYWNKLFSRNKRFTVTLFHWFISHITIMKVLKVPGTFKVYYYDLYLFNATGLFLYPQDTSENLRYRKRPVTWNRLRRVIFGPSSQGSILGNKVKFKLFYPNWNLNENSCHIRVQPYLKHIETFCLSD